MDDAVGGKFKIGSKIGSGTFGEVFTGFDIQSGEEVAIKMEPVKSEHPTLHHESEIYDILEGEEARIPNLKWFGVEGEYNAMVIDRLGPSLESLFNYCGRKFSLKTVLMLADQLIDIVMYIHTRGVVHCDIKPENLLMGLGSKSKHVYAIDFGLARLYRDVETNEHIRYRSDRHFTGSHRYAAIHTHYGCERSRRDDLESLGYVLIYFLKRSLPWQGLSEIEDKSWKNKIILETKFYAPLDKDWESFPSEFTEYIDYCRHLPFKGTPDYCYLKNLFRDLFIREGYQFDYVFDWTLIPMDGSLQKQEESQHIDPENLQRIEQWRI